MKQLLIIGAGGLGREIIDFAESTKEFNSSWQIKGFLDDRQQILDGKDSNYKVICAPELYSPEENDVFFCAIMDPESRKKYVQLFLNKGCTFISIISPTAAISTRAKMGVGIFVGLHVGISCDAIIGDFCMLNTFVSIGHDAKIGQFVSIHNRALVSGGTTIGEFSEIGTNATVLQRSKMDPYAKLGAGSVLIGKAPSRRLMMGVPAKVMNF